MPVVHLFCCRRCRFRCRCCCCSNKPRARHTRLSDLSGAIFAQCKRQTKIEKKRSKKTTTYTWNSTTHVGVYMLYWVCMSVGCVYSPHNNKTHANETNNKSDDQVFCLCVCSAWCLPEFEHIKAVFLLSRLSVNKANRKTGAKNKRTHTHTASHDVSAISFVLLLLLLLLSSIQSPVERSTGCVQ